MKDRIKRMKKKGWNDEEIDKTLKMLSKYDKHAEYNVSSNRIIYWTVLLVLTISNFLVAVFLIPILLAISTIKFYFLIAALAFIFGLFFDLLIRDIEHLKTKHHVFAAVFMPVMAVLNLFVMIGVTNKLVDILKIGQHEDPIFASFIYVFVFMLPYVINTIREELGR